jgi:hypothetical protein
MSAVSSNNGRVQPLPLVGKGWGGRRFSKLAHRSAHADEPPTPNLSPHGGGVRLTPKAVDA